MLLSTGERQSCALCAMAINDLGHRAISLTGSQAGIVTDTSHTKARILEVRADRIREALDEDAIVLVAGFQGVSTARDVTTLGRGGSDTTAVALAAAVGADECEIYTDVAGRLQRRPAHRARRAQAADGLLRGDARDGGLAAPACCSCARVEYARNHGVRIHCRSSFDDAPGTVVVGEDVTVEQPSITAVTHSTGEARVTLVGVPDTPGIAGRIATALAEANVNVDMIVQNEPRLRRRRARRCRSPCRATTCTPRRARARRPSSGVGALDTDEAMGKVSVVGAGMKTHPGVAAKVFATLGDEGINIEMISTSPIRISCVIRGERVPDAVRALHAAFELSGPDTIRPERPFGEFASMRVAVVGATGAVGTVMRRLLRSAAFPARRGRPVRLRALGRQGARRRDGRSQPLRRRHDRRLRPRAVLRRRRHVARVGAAVRRRAARSSSTTRAPGGWTPTSRSSSPRSTPTALDDTRKGIVANPNCTTMVVMLPLKALHDAFGLRAMVATSFQAAGGAGQKGIDELAAQVAPLAADVDAARRRRRERGARGRARGPREHARLQRRAAARHDRRGGLHRRGDEAPQRVAQDPRHPGPARSRRPACACRSWSATAIAVRATFARERRPRRARSTALARVPEPRRRGRARRRWSGPAATRRRSAACAATSPTRAVAELLRRRRQPAQGRRAEHGAARRAAASSAGSSAPRARRLTTTTAGSFF